MTGRLGGLLLVVNLEYYLTKVKVGGSNHAMKFIFISDTTRTDSCTQEFSRASRFQPPYIEWTPYPNCVTLFGMGRE